MFGEEIHPGHALMFGERADDGRTMDTQWTHNGHSMDTTMDTTMDTMNTWTFCACDT